MVYTLKIYPTDPLCICCLSKKSPTRPAERTPKEPECLIARSQLRGLLVRSIFIFDGIIFCKHPFFIGKMAVPIFGMGAPFLIYPTDALCTLLGAGFNLLFFQKRDPPLGGNDTCLTDMLVLVGLKPPSIFYKCSISPLKFTLEGLFRFEWEMLVLF